MGPRPADLAQGGLGGKAALRNYAWAFEISPCCGHTTVTPHRFGRPGEPSAYTDLNVKSIR